MVITNRTEGYRFSTQRIWCFIFCINSPKVCLAFIPRRFRSSKHRISNLRQSCIAVSNGGLSFGSSLFMDTRNIVAFTFSVVRPFHLTRILTLCFCQLLGVVFVEHWRGISVSVTASQKVSIPIRFPYLSWVLS